MQVKENVALKDYSTIRLGGNAKYFTEVKSKEDLVAALEWARHKNVKFFILGEGSNIIFTDKGFDGIVIKIEIPGFEEIEENIFRIGAGENWDKTVEKLVTKGLSGVEAMSFIPGTVGATPVQNVGAYGQEIKDTLTKLTAYDTQANEFVVLTNFDCGFSYRNSIFKSSQAGRYVIVDITLRLHKQPMTPPFYDSLQRYLDKYKISDYSPATIRKAVIAIRQHKLPDPKKIANVGSFFKNPLISTLEFEKLQKQYPELKGFPTEDKVKLSAGWLIENAGLAGQHFERVGLHKHNALVLVTQPDATFQDLLALKEEIIDKVQQKFSITLEQEPQIIE